MFLGFLKKLTLTDDFIVEGLTAILPLSYKYVGNFSVDAVKGDFCIFYEDSDGNIIILDNKTGIGSSDVIVGGYPCGTDIP